MQCLSQSVGQHKHHPDDIRFTNSFLPSSASGQQHSQLWVHVTAWHHVDWDSQDHALCLGALQKITAPSLSRDSCASTLCYFATNSNGSETLEGVESTVGLQTHS